MLTGSEPVGVLSAMSRVPRPFTDAEVKLLSSIADHVAIALKKANLHEQTIRQSQERAFLFNLAAAIVPLQDVESIAHEALNRTLNFLEWPIGVFLLEDPISNALVPHARVGDSDTLQTLISRIRETAYQQNILHPVSITNTQTPPRTVVQIPIHARYHTLGWLIFGTPEATDILPQTQETLTAASNYLGIAVENVQLYQEMAEREQSSRALYQITRAMTGHNLTEMLKQTLEELHGGIAYEISGILLSEPQHIEVTRLRVALPPEKLTDIRTHLRMSLGTLGNHTEIGKEDTQIIIRGQESGTLNTDTLLSYLEVPIIQESDPLGVIMLARQQPFRARDQRLLFILAYQLSKVLSTIRLFHQAQEQAQQLEQTNALLRAQESTQADILNDVAQELRTPITFIQSYAELLHEEISGKLSPSQQQALNILQEQAGLLSRLIRDLSIMKTITSRTLHHQQTNLTQLLKQAVDVAQITATEKGQSLNLSLAPNTPTVNIAAEHIHQVVDIFLNNAIKFTPQGGCILLSTRHYDEHQLRIAVTNPGPAVTQGKLNLIFERLHQGQLGRKYPGIGVGLTLAQRIVTAHNGTIGVDYSEGLGNTFYFTLPK
jgi:signal transduction histidine kinase